MKKGAKIAVVALIIVFLVLVIKFIFGGPEGNENIIVGLPHSGAVVGKEFSVMGKARGTWYFEASFLVQVLDKEGNVLFAAPAQAQGDWMTTEFVPFKADVKISANYIGPATLVLKKDNPSGLPANDASVSLPITIEY
jgi:hypothetical protein